MEPGRLAGLGGHFAGGDAPELRLLHRVHHPHRARGGNRVPPTPTWVSHLGQGWWCWCSLRWSSQASHCREERSDAVSNIVGKERLVFFCSFVEADHADKSNVAHRGQVWRVRRASGSRVGTVGEMSQLISLSVSLSLPPAPPLSHLSHFLSLFTIVLTRAVGFPSPLVLPCHVMPCHAMSCHVMYFYRWPAGTR